ncbi:MAG: sodium:calcium antiporter [Patescibacteria group bacterium]
MDIAIYLLSFFLIWQGSSLVVGSISKLAHKLNLSTFSVSFFVLGFLTSLPEIMVGLNSVIGGKPEIFVGNLLGGTLALFIFVIPLLAVFGNGLSLRHELNEKHLLVALVVILAPAFLILDNSAVIFDGLVLVSLYALLFYILERGGQKITNPSDGHSFHWIKDVAKIVFGITLVVVSSYLLVDKTVYFAKVLGLSPFIISFIIVALGTNLPELALVARAAISGHKDIAFGDFLGSAVANSLIMGVMIIFNRGDIVIPTNFFMQFIFIFGGIALFYYFSRSHQDISRREGLILLAVYVIFLAVQLWNR